MPDSRRYGIFFHSIEMHRMNQAPLGGRAAITDPGIFFWRPRPTPLDGTSSCQIPPPVPVLEFLMEGWGVCLLVALITSRNLLLPRTLLLVYSLLYLLHILKSITWRPFDHHHNGFPVWAVMWAKSAWSCWGVLRMFLHYNVWSVFLILSKTYPTFPF